MELTRELSEQAGIDPLRDRYVAGYLAAEFDVQNIDIEEVDLGD